MLHLKKWVKLKRFGSLSMTPAGSRERPSNHEKVEDKLRELDFNWLELAKNELKPPMSINDLIGSTAEGLLIKPVYTKKNIEPIEDEIPGKFPYTRGPYATMYTVRPWTIRQVGVSTSWKISGFAWTIKRSLFMKI
jgi:hypothetical protein